MPNRRDPTLTAAAVRQRSERFASLRAAQRALGRSVHPSELAQANQQARQLLIELQALGTRAKEQEAGLSVAGEQQEAIDRADLRRVDQRLDDISTRTREILDSLEISQLRSTVLLRSAQHPDEVRGLIDVMLEGDVDDDKNLRTLEYLVTVLSSEERDGRRVLVREPSEVSRRLREFAERRLADGDADHLVAERIFDNTMTMLPAAEDLGAIRDRIRLYKEELGSHILHPRILSVAVSYNIAMWNQVASLIEGGRSIDSLADELLTLDATGGARDSIELPSTPAPASESTDILGSEAFARIVSALRDRLVGQAASDTPEAKVVLSYRLEGMDGLHPAEIEAFDRQEDDEISRLTREAVVLGLTIRHRAEVEDSLRALGIDPEQLRTGCLHELTAAMNAVARELFAESRYDDAFRLSEVKTRNLAAIATGRSGEWSSSPGGSGVSGRRGRRTGSSPGGFLRFDWGLPSGQLSAALLLLLLPLLASLLWSSGGGIAIVTGDELSQISPFLESGFRRQRGDATQFVGRLGRTWDYLGKRERLRVTAEIGIAMKERGIHSVVLEDEWQRVQARYEDGPVLEEALVPVLPLGRR